MNSLSFKNLINRKGRTTAMIIVVVLLAVSMLGGYLMLTSLNRGLENLETRLGADIIVVPDEAKSKKDLESILLDGVPGYFYMDKEYYDKVAEREGISRISAQYYLVSAKAGCCSMPVQVIGFDPDTDFTVTPWITESGGSELGTGDVVAGCNISRNVGDSVTFFGVDCRIVAKLDRTGTELDNAVYGTYGTIKELIEGSKSNSFTYFQNQDPDDIVSSILIDVQDGYGVQDVADDINLHVRGVSAVSTRSMLSGVSESLSGVTGIIRLLMIIMWILVLVILLVVFSTMVNERKKEFAVLRSIGMSRRMLSRVVLTESALIGLAGGCIGSLLAIILIIPFRNILETEIGLPFLTPGAGSIAMMTVISIVLCTLVGGIAASYSAVKLSNVDTGLILREGN